MIDYGAFQFAAPPGVGSRWVAKAAQATGLGWHNPRQAYMPFGPRTNDKQFRVSLARHPCDWLWNCYTLLARPDTPKEFLGKLTTLPCATAIEQGYFEGFVRCYLHSTPGCLSELHLRYEADSVCRYEDMPWALVELLTSLGVSRGMTSNCAKMRPHRVSHVFFLEPSMRVAVMAAEREMVERYDYW